MENFARIAAPLKKKLRKGEDPEVEKLNEETVAFDRLKEKLAYPQYWLYPATTYHTSSTRTPATIKSDAYYNRSIRIRRFDR